MNDILKIAVVGAGGIGRSLALVAHEYSRRDIPYLNKLTWTWFDDDEVELENCWTQGFSKEAATLCDSKVAALGREFRGLKFTPRETRIEDASDLSGFDVIFIACDNLETRRLIYNHCLDSGTYFVDMRVNGTTFTVLDGTMAADELLASVAPPAEGADAAPTSCLYKWEKERKIIHTTPLIAASMGFQFFLNHLRGEKNEAVDMIS